MKKVEIITKGALITNHPAGSKIACLLDDGGNLYVPAATFPAEMFAVAAAPANGKAVSAPAAATPATPAASTGKGAPADYGTYTEKKLAALEREDLLAILESWGIDPEEYDGKNTHKKLSLLILGAQEDPNEVPVGFAVSGTSAASPAAAAEEEEEEEETVTVRRKAAAPAAAGKAAPKASAGWEEVDMDDLEKGDTISALWKNLAETYTGEVISTRGGNINVRWEDGEESILDPKVHVELQRKA